ncbi:site-specific integrase [uncultured Metabacillus sp.]|uniref:site-specific integrase n=1 Tax=uncultured Metabacillus sp. TaxID=2860135 RepID=UPI00262725EF|nr:site-specific integrase [uncultured Metabacillus sp.]
MNLVQPIRDKDTIEEIKDYLKEKNYRNYILFMLGINTGLRISDILRLRVRDVEGWYITIREKKTKKFKRIKITSDLKKDLRNYVKDKGKNEFLIKSREGKNKPITRGMAYIILQEVAQEFQLESIGTHSLRKTFGYWFYKQFKDVAALQKLFNHTDPKETLRYIGIEQDNLDDMMRRFNL